MDNKKKKIYFMFTLIFIIMVGSVAFIFREINSDRIMKNVYIDNTNIGSLSKDDAKEKISKEYKVKDIKLKFQENQWNIKPSEIDFLYDVENTIDTAYSLNKESGIVNNIKTTIKSLFGEKVKLQIRTSYSQKKLDKIVNNISKEINVSSENASLNINSGEILIIDEVTGLQVEEKKTIDAIKKGISKKQFEYEIIVKEDKPKIVKDDLKEVDTVLGSYSTKFDSKVSGRTQNIRLSAQRTSDVLLMPGDTFSYNTHTGKRTLSNGYKNAPVIVQGVVQEGIGGGVCQVSTTLYNATLYAGLEYVELRNHSIPSSYASKGRDATVADGSIDFVFKNNLDYPIYIKNSVYGNTVTCKVYGSSKDKQQIDIVTNVDAVSIAPVKKVDDPTIDKGTEKVLEKGRDGYTVSTYRIYRDSNGKEIKREKVFKSYYPKKQGIVAVGTKEIIEEIPPEEVPETEIPPTPETEVPPVPETEVPPTPEGETPSAQPENPSQTNN